MSATLSEQSLGRRFVARGLQGDQVAGRTECAAMLLSTHALAAGPLAASQPGFTIGDPLTAALLGVFLFGESLDTSAAALAGQLAGLAALVAGVAALSHSRLVTGEAHPGLPKHIDGHAAAPRSPPPARTSTDERDYPRVPG